MRRAWLISAGVAACLALSGTAWADPAATKVRAPQGSWHPVQGQRVTSPAHVAHPPANGPKLGDWDRSVRGLDRDHAGLQWREGHHGWDNGAPWRHDPGWWRHHWAFRWFYGPRLGFFFIPEVGYVAVPPDLGQHYWIVGNYLPAWFWRFVVSDYWNFGLPQPPDGCVWVWVDNDVALIDPSDGYIIDIVHNIW